MLRKDGKIALLKRVPLFSHCSKKQLAEIASITDLVVFPAGTRLIREGAVGREFMVIVEGAVEVRRKGRKINELGAGGFIGEMALISKAPRNATVTTSQDSSLLVVSDRAFWGLLERVPRSGDERDQSVGRAPAAPRHLSSVSISGPMCAYSSVLTVATTIAV